MITQQQQKRNAPNIRFSLPILRTKNYAKKKKCAATNKSEAVVAKIRDNPSVLTFTKTGVSCWNYQQAEVSASESIRYFVIALRCEIETFSESVKK